MGKSKRESLGPRLAKKRKYAKAVAVELRDMAKLMTEFPSLLTKLAEILENIPEDQ